MKASPFEAEQKASQGSPCCCPWQPPPAQRALSTGHSFPASARDLPVHSEIFSGDFLASGLRCFPGLANSLSILQPRPHPEGLHWPLGSQQMTVQPSGANKNKSKGCWVGVTFPPCPQRSAACTDQPEPTPVSALSVAVSRRLPDIYTKGYFLEGDIQRLCLSNLLLLPRRQQSSSMKGTPES